MLPAIKVTIVCGPTGVGKSAYAIALATKNDGEIINADSQQVYRGCDIGTGKLSMAERQGIVHHCLDLVEPDQSFDAAQFVTAADRAIADIVGRGKQPIIVGGTGLYLKALVFGLAKTPPADPAYRAELQSLLQAEGAEVLHHRLATIDPAAAQQIHPRHTTRVMRALEVHHLTGQSIFVLHAWHGFQTPRYDATWIGLERPRAELYRRVNARIEKMLASGWCEEVEHLLARYGPSVRPLRAIGYRELVRHLRGELTIDSATTLIQRNTRCYAKRQCTWFLAIPAVRWIAPTT